MSDKPSETLGGPLPGPDPATGPILKYGPCVKKHPEPFFRLTEVSLSILEKSLFLSNQALGRYKFPGLSRHYKSPGSQYVLMTTKLKRKTVIILSKFLCRRY